MTETDKDRETNRDRDRQTDRQTDRQADRERVLKPNDLAKIRKYWNAGFLPFLINDVTSWKLRFRSTGGVISHTLTANLRITRQLIDWLNWFNAELCHQGKRGTNA